MAILEDFPIWPFETGITGLPEGEDLTRLQLPSMQDLRSLWIERKSEIKDTKALDQFSERLAREWAIETGQIENLYQIERGVTVTLVERGFSSAIMEEGASNKPPEEVLALLEDQKNALDLLFEFVKRDGALTTGYIKELHAAMTRSQRTTIGIDQFGNEIELELHHGQYKTQQNFPVRGNRRYLYCPPEQTASEMDRLIEIYQLQLSESISPEAQAAWIHHRFTQIHPFQDGNGRIARALASLVLIKGGMFPLIVYSADKDSYFNVLELADKGNLRPLVLLIARSQQAAFAKANKLFATIGPAPTTSDGAAEVLSKLLHNAPSARAARLQFKGDQFSNQLRTYVKSKLESSMRILAQSDPTATIKDGGQSTINQHSEAKRYLDEDFTDVDGERSSPLWMNTWMIHIMKEWVVRLHVSPLADDLDERIVATLMMHDHNTGEKISGKELGIAPIYLAIGQTVDELKASIIQWSEDAVLKLLAYFIELASK